MQNFDVFLKNTFAHLSFNLLTTFIRLDVKNISLTSIELLFKIRNISTAMLSKVNMDKNTDASLQQNSNDTTAVKSKNTEKFKTTLYLTQEAEHAYTELYIHRLRKDRKTDKSKIASDAIIALYEKECFPSKVHDQG